MSAKSTRRRAARILRKALKLSLKPATKLARALLGRGAYKSDLELAEISGYDAVGFASPCGDSDHCSPELYFRGPAGHFSRQELTTILTHLAKARNRARA